MKVVCIGRNWNFRPVVVIGSHHPSLLTDPDNITVDSTNQSHPSGTYSATVEVIPSIPGTHSLCIQTEDNTG